MKPSRCASYARYSSDRQKPATIEDQNRVFEDFAEKKGWRILGPHTYADPALSGTRLGNRPGLERLLKAAADPSRPFDVILFYDTSRLARNVGDAARIREHLDFHRIRYISVSEGIDSESDSAGLFFGFNSLIDALYIEKVRKATYRGLQGIALRGQHTGSRCFGYRGVPIEDPTRTDPRGRPLVLGARLVVDEAQAEVVRRIFTLYASGYSLKRIVRLLNSERLPAPGGKSWHHPTVREILLNDRYRGLILWGRTLKVRCPESGRQVRRRREESEWTKVPGPRIVSDELWRAVRDRLERVKTFYKNRGQRPGLSRGRAASSRYLLSGILRCGPCARSMCIVVGGKQRAKYGCPGVKIGTCSNRLRIAVDAVETRLLHRLQAEVLRPAAIDYAASQVEREVKRALAHAGGELAGLRRDKAQAERKIRNLMRALGDGYSPALTGELAAVEGELASTEERLRRSRPATPRFTRRALRAFVASRLADLRGLLSADAVRAKAELLKHVREIRLYPDGKSYRAEGEWDLLGAATTVRSGHPASPSSANGVWGTRGAVCLTSIRNRLA
jgi:DNA invertase Pin-like site-specific DNA recombinase